MKGINGLDEIAAKDLVDNGIICNWWRTAGTITPGEVKLHFSYNYWGESW